MAEAAAILSVVTAVTGLIRELIPVLAEIIRTATRGRKECRILKDELELIQSEVEQMERQIRELHDLDPDAKGYLNTVEVWLEKLKEELEGASHNVHKFDKPRKFRRFMNYKLSKRIATQSAKITKLAEQRVMVSPLLTTLLKKEQDRKAEQAKARYRKPPSKWRQWLCSCCRTEQSGNK
jgi:chromosome segregation ATPase